MGSVTFDNSLNHVEWYAADADPCAHQPTDDARIRICIAPVREHLVEGLLVGTPAQQVVESVTKGDTNEARVHHRADVLYTVFTLFYIS